MSAIKRTGVWFAFAAWLMQISVFLTPIFSDQVSVGHGVCVQLADVVEHVNRGHIGAHAAHDHAQHTRQLLQQLNASAAPDALQDTPPLTTHSRLSDTRRLLDSSSLKHQTKKESKQLITQNHITPPSTAPPSANTATHHATDPAQCGFCLLIGHSVLPPVPDAQLAPVAFFDLIHTTRSDLTDHARLSLRGLIPQSRAPPFLV